MSERLTVPLRASSSRTSATCSTRSRLGMPLPLLTIALPIGISFFTFQAITYVVDVKRGDARAGVADRRRRSTSASSRTWSPGPIVRAREFLPQLDDAARPAAGVAVGAGLVLIALGLVKKVLIADYLARDDRRPGVRASREAYVAPDVILARLRLRGPDLLRLLRLHRHRDRPRAADRLRLPAELQQPVPGDRVPRLLAPLAHDPVALPARLPLHPARRQPRSGGASRSPTAT